MRLGSEVSGGERQYKIKMLMQTDVTRSHRNARVESGKIAYSFKCHNKVEDRDSAGLHSEA